jgi:hypothetical protein
VGGEARGAESGQEPGGGTDDYRPAQPAGPGDRRDDGGPTFGMGADDGGGGPGEYPGRPAGQRKQDGFGQELGAGPQPDRRQPCRIRGTQPRRRRWCFSATSTVIVLAWVVALVVATVPTEVTTPGVLLPRACARRP